MGHFENAVLKTLILNVILICFLLQSPITSDYSHAEAVDSSVNHEGKDQRVDAGEVYGGTFFFSKPHAHKKQKKVGRPRKIRKDSRHLRNVPISGSRLSNAFGTGKPHKANPFPQIHRRNRRAVDKTTRQQSAAKPKYAINEPLLRGIIRDEIQQILNSEKQLGNTVRGRTRRYEHGYGRYDGPFFSHYWSPTPEEYENDRWGKGPKGIGIPPVSEAGQKAIAETWGQGVPGKGIGHLLTPEEMNARWAAKLAKGGGVVSGGGGGGKKGKKSSGGSHKVYQPVAHDDDDSDTEEASAPTTTTTPKPAPTRKRYRLPCDALLCPEGGMWKKNDDGSYYYVDIYDESSPYYRPPADF